jgi:TonB family protein
MVYNSDPHVPSATLAAGHVRSTQAQDYPVYARHEHISGVVVLAAHVTREGKVIDADVISTSNEIFDEAAVNAVKHWVYAPFTFRGQPVNTHILLHINFAAR